MANLVKDLLNLQYSSDFNVQGTNETVVNLILEDTQNFDTTIYGSVNDGINPISNATVSVLDIDGNPYAHTITDIDGYYSFEGLTIGTYGINAICNGYKTSEVQSVSLTESCTIEINFTLLADSNLGTVTGIVTTDNQTPLEGVKLSLLDFNKVTIAATYSIDDGEFVIYDIPNGEYTLIATKQGYWPSNSINITIDSGNILNIFINMLIDDPFNGTINGIITNEQGQGVEGCFVGLYKVIQNGNITEENLIAYTKTNSQGKYLFGNVSEGTYVIGAKMNL